MNSVFALVTSGSFQLLTIAVPLLQLHKKIKDNARSIGDAIASISLGEFVSEQERMSKQIGNQTTALTRLKAAGIEGSVALEAVADATFAASIANKKLSDKQVKKIADTWKEATKNKKNYAAIQTIEAEKASQKLHRN